MTCVCGHDRQHHLYGQVGTLARLGYCTLNNCDCSQYRRAVVEKATAAPGEKRVVSRG